MKKDLCFVHPFLLAMAPILSLWGKNFGSVEPKVAGTLLGVSLVSTLVLMVLFTIIMRSTLRGALMTSLFVLLFFFYGHAFNIVDHLDWFYYYWQIHLLIGSFCISALIGAFKVLRSRGNLQDISLTVCVASVIMVALPSYQVLAGVISHRHESLPENPSGFSDVSNPKPIPAILHDDPAKPDVYYIILDGYARADVLKNVHGFDNSEFINQLRDRGFFVAPESTANYPLTFISLASSLNMNYLDEVVAETEDPKDQKPYVDMIQNPLIARIFRSHGYRYVHFATGYHGTEDSKIADLIFSYRPRWIRGEFRDVLISTTALRLFESNLAASHLYEFRTLQKVPHIPGPKFVFAHFVLPHEPYIFERDGKVRKNIPSGLQFHDKTGKRQKGDDRKAYTEQLVFVNHKIIETIDAILAHSKTRPIIVLQSDHGSGSFFPGENPKVPEYKQEIFLRERFPNLNAYLVPDATREKLYASITPVNSFRILCNDLFATAYGRLPDRNYYCWFSNIRPVDVTEVVKLGPPEANRVAKQDNVAGLAKGDWKR